MQRTSLITRNVVIAAVVLLNSVSAHAQRVERISASITLNERIDPIEDTNYSWISIRSGEGAGFSVPAQVSINCFGRNAAAWIGYDDPVVGATHLIWRFDASKPDTVALPREPGTKAYGSPGLWLVLYEPLEIVQIPDSVLHRFSRSARSANRLVVRVAGPAATRDSYFAISGLSRALDRLSCLSQTARLAGSNERLLGEPVYYDRDDLDVVPLPLDSAGTAVALRREIAPAEIRDRPLGSILATLSISATGQVDSISIIASDRQIRGVEHFFNSLRFRPGMVNGNPVRSSISVQIMVAEPKFN